MSTPETRQEIAARLQQIARDLLTHSELGPVVSASVEHQTSGTEVTSVEWALPGGTDMYIRLWVRKPQSNVLALLDPIGLRKTGEAV